MKSLYITSVRTYSGKTALSLGLGLRMQAAGLKVGYLKPMSTQPFEAGGRVLDSDAEFVRRTLRLETPPWELSPVVVTAELLHQVMDGSLKRDLLADVEQALRQAGENNDVVIVEGGATMREGYSVGLNTLSMVERLNVPVISVVGYAEDCVGGMCVMDDALAAQFRLGDHLLGVVLNEVPREDLRYYREQVTPFLEKQGVKVFGVLPYDPYLRSLTVGEVIDVLNAQVLTGDRLRDHLIEHMSVGAMSVESALPRFRRLMNKAVITGGDRTDLQMAALETSTACLVLTGNLAPNSAVITRAEEVGAAVLLVSYNTLESVERVEAISGRSSLSRPEKLSRFQATLAEHLNYEELAKALGL